MSGENKKLGFVGAMRHFFGLNGKTLGDFSKELKALSEEDKEYFRKGLIQNGYDLQS